MRARFEWEIGRRTLALGERTLVMGVVNVTPDSFSDGGRFVSSEAAIEYALGLLEQGADILDVGGESTRPGAAVGGRERATVSAEEEIARVVPVIAWIRRARPEAVISIDTYKAATARAAAEAGADIVNDVSGMTWDSEMSQTLGRLTCGVILMHTRGRPEEWRALPKLEDPVGETRRGLKVIAANAGEAGIRRERVVLDPGFGFGKRFGENYPLLAHFGEFAKLGFPLLAGPSRKSFVGRTVGRRLAEIAGSAAGDQPASERLVGSLAAVTVCVLAGAHLVRVHDVRATVEAVAVADAILAAE